MSMLLCLIYSVGEVATDVMCNFKSNRNTFSIPRSIDYFRFRPGIEWYRYQVIGNRPPLSNSSVASLTIKSRYANISVFIDSENN